MTHHSDLTHLARVWWKSTDLCIAEGSGMTMTTVEGRQLLDFTSGVGVTSTGHSHPAVVGAVQRQVARIMHAQVNLVSHDMLGPATEALNRVTPDPIDTFFLTNSGAEAVEAGVKLAKQASGKPNIIVFERGFHGRTMLTMAMTASKVGYRSGYGPLPAGIHVAPYPYAFRTGESEDEAAARCLESLEWMLRAVTAPSETAAIVVETVLGEGGFVFPSATFLRGISAICQREGVLLVLDEIQAGVGRTGRWFAFEHFGIVPDIVVMGKGIGSGFPVAAIGASRELMDRWPTGSHGGTYGGNPVACAAVAATLGVIEADDLVGNAAVRGRELSGLLADGLADCPYVGDLRSLGLMVGIEITTPDGAPDGARAAAAVKRCLDDDLLVLTCGLEGNVIRLLPALVLDAEDVARAGSILVDAITHGE